MKTKIFVLILLCVFASFSTEQSAEAKHMMPTAIKPIIDHGREITSFYEATDQGFTVFILSKNIKNGALQWKSEIYQRGYNPKVQIDEQEIHLKSVKLIHSQVVIVDERDATYKIDSGSGKLLEPKTPKQYPVFTMPKQ